MNAAEPIPPYRLDRKSAPTLKDRMDGFYLVLLGGLVLLLMGTALETTPGAMGDFKALYYPTRCLLTHHDPYNSEAVLGTLRAESGMQQDYSQGDLLMVPHFNYLPTTLPFISLFAWLPFHSARIAWMLTSSTILIVGGFLIWDLASCYAPSLSGAMVGFLLGNSELIAVNGNVAGICAGLCATAVWCFANTRLEMIGVISLALALGIKPHLAGFVWLYFLLSTAYRKRALQTLAVLAAFGVLSYLWVSSVSPRWIGEWRTTMQMYSAHGSFNDQGPTGANENHPSLIINLQTAVALFDDDPKIYDLVTWLIVGALFALWIAATRKAKSSSRLALVGLAAAASLTLLPVYHRECDAKLLLLTVPACASLWSEAGRRGRIAVALVATGLFVTADLPWAIDIWLLGHLHRPDSGFRGRLLVASQVLPVPLALLGEAIFFLWVYARSTRRGASEAEMAMRPATIL
jgi:hypothetical protein